MEDSLVVWEGFSEEDCWRCLENEQGLAGAGRGRTHQQEETVSRARGTQDPQPRKRRGRSPAPHFKAEHPGAGGGGGRALAAADWAARPSGSVPRAPIGGREPGTAAR